MRFETVQAQRQYNQVLCRDARRCKKMWGCVALQFLAADGGALRPFMRDSEIYLAVACSGQLDESREISRFTVLDAEGHAVVDWDLARVARKLGQPHIPNPESGFFEYALAIDRAREQAVETSLPPLTKWRKPQMVCRSAAPLGFPIANPAGELRLSAAVKQLVGDDKSPTAARAAMLSLSTESDDGWYTPESAVHKELHESLKWFIDLSPFIGVTIKNPLERYVEMPNPWVGIDLPNPADLGALETALIEMLPVARKRLGTAQALFDDQDLLEGAVDINGNFNSAPVRASGRRVPKVEELAPLLQRALGHAYAQLTRHHLEQMVAFPTTPVLVNSIGKPMFYWKGRGSNVEALNRVGIVYPDLPTCFLPREC